MVYTTNKRSITIARKPDVSSANGIRPDCKRARSKQKKFVSTKPEISGAFLTLRDIEFVTDLAENPRPNEGLKRLVDRVRSLKAAP